MKDFDYNSLGAGYYDKILYNGSGARRFWHLHKFSRIESLISPKKEMSILDVGCAAGSFLGHLKTPFNQALGLDISPEQIAYATEKYGSKTIHFLQGDVRDRDLAGYTFDYIVISEIIEHIPYADTVAILKRMQKHLKPHGQIIITSPNYRSLWPLIEWILNRILPIGYDHQHIAPFTPKRLRQIIEQAGLTVRHQSTFFIISPFLPFLPIKWKHKICLWESRLFPSWGSIILASASL